MLLCPPIFLNYNPLKYYIYIFEIIKYHKNTTIDNTIYKCLVLLKEYL